MSELPIGWVNVPIGSFARVVGGGTPPSKDPANFAKPGEGIPWITPADLSGYRSQTIKCGSRDLTPEGLAACGATLMPAGTVLFSSRAPIGYVAIAANEIATNQGFKSFVLPGGFDPRFTYYQLKHLKPEAEAIATGTTFKELSGAAAATLPFSVAPLQEQTRIADQLDALLTRINACNDRLDNIPALLKRFRQAVLAAATSGLLTENYRKSQPTIAADGVPIAWIKSTIRAITTDLRYGTSKKCGYSTDGVGVLRIPNIADHGRIDIRDLKSAQFDDKEIEKLSLAAGDLLVIRSNGSVDLVGKTSIVTTKEAGLLFAGYLMRLRVNTDVAMPEFVRLCLAAPTQRTYIETTAKSTSGVNNLNAEELRELPIWLPKLDEQAEIVRRVEGLCMLADSIEVRYKSANLHAQRLTPLALSKAFRGDLVPQDPSDEPASALLAKIALSRGGASLIPKIRKTRAPRAVRTPKESSTMTKSRQDDEVKGKPYLAGHLRRLGEPVPAQVLFKASELPVADFYKQLAWEVAQGLVKDNTTTLEPGHAAG